MPTLTITQTYLGAGDSLQLRLTCDAAEDLADTGVFLYQVVAGAGEFLGVCSVADLGQYPLDDALEAVPFFRSNQLELNESGAARMQLVKDTILGELQQLLYDVVSHTNVTSTATIILTS